jgi:hypothetical protein
VQKHSLMLVAAPVQFVVILLGHGTGCDALPAHHEPIGHGAHEAP